MYIYVNCTPKSNRYSRIIYYYYLFISFVPIPSNLEEGRISPLNPHGFIFDIDIESQSLAVKITSGRRFCTFMASKTSLCS